MQIKGGCIADPRQAHQPWELDEQMQQGSNHHAPCDPIDAHARRQHQNAKDHSQRVHDGRQSGVKKLLVGVQDPHHQPAHAKDDWREQLNAQEMNGQILLSRVGKPGSKQMADHPGRKNSAKDAEDCQDDQNEVDDGGCQSPGVFALLASQQGGKGRDKSRCKRSTGDQVKKGIAKLVGCVMRIQFAARAKGARQQQAGKQGDQFGKNKGDHDRARGASDLAVSIRG